jgi:hypothetical protein
MLGRVMSVILLSTPGDIDLIFCATLGDDSQTCVSALATRFGCWRKFGLCLSDVVQVLGAKSEDCVPVAESSHLLCGGADKGNTRVRR